MRRGASSALRALGLLIAVVLVLGQTSSVSAIGTARISGNVTDTQGLPAPDVDVRAYVAVGDAWLPFAMTSTDAQGDYALAALDAASYAVEFADPQGALVSEWWDDTVGPTPVDLVVVGEGASIEGIDAALAAMPEAYIPRTRHLVDGRPVYANRLVLEASPYLLQHAHNPVDWRPWGDASCRISRNTTTTSTPSPSPGMAALIAPTTLL